MDSLTSSDLTRVVRVRRHLADGTARQIRVDAHVGQPEIAAVLGVSRASVAAYETGRRVPSTPVALRLAALLDAIAAVGERAS